MADETLVICSCGEEFQSPQALWDHFRSEPEESSKRAFLEDSERLAKALEWTAAILDDIGRPNNAKEARAVVAEHRKLVGPA